MLYFVTLLWICPVADDCRPVFAYSGRFEHEEACYETAGHVATLVRDRFSIPEEITFEMECRKTSQEVYFRP